MRIMNRDEADYNTLVFEPINAVYIQAIGDEGLVRWLAEKFIMKMPDWKYTPAAKYRKWKGDVYFVDSDGRIPIPLISEVVNVMDAAGYKWYADLQMDKYFDKEVTLESVKAFADEILKGTRFVLRDYQLFCVYKMLRNKRGVIEVSVGGGKSIIAYAFIRAMIHMGNRVLLIVPTIALVNQIKADFIDYGWNDVNSQGVFVGGDNLYRYGPTEYPLVVTTYQSCVKYSLDWYESFGTVIVDEAHGASSDSMRHIGEATTNAFYRIGMTGTLPESSFSCRRIEVILGDVIATVTSDELIKLGVLTPVLINAIFAVHPMNTPQFQVSDYAIESAYIESVAYRREFVARLIDVKTLHTENSLVLVKSVNQLTELAKLIREKYPHRKVFEFYGKTGAAEKEMIRNELGEMEGAVILSTYKSFSTGINVPKIHHVFLASGSRAKTSVIQSVGRVLRLHITKLQATVWDIIDVFPWDIYTLNALMNEEDKMKAYSYAVKHYFKRKKFFEKAKFPIKEFNVPMVDGR